MPDLNQRETIAPILLADLRSHKLRYKLYGACYYPKYLAESLEGLSIKLSFYLNFKWLIINNLTEHDQNYGHGALDWR